MRKKQPFFSRTQSLPSPNLDVFIASKATKGSVLEMLDPAKLITHWRAEGWYPLAPTSTPERRGHDVPFDVDADRMHSLVRCIEREDPLPEIIVGSYSHEKGQGLTFPDGRHRIVLFEAMGLSCIPASIPKDEADLVLELAGAEELDPRVRVKFRGRAPRPRF